MSTEKTNNEINEVFDNVPAESTKSLSAPDAATTPNPNWSRRTFLKAAALGAATVAVLGKGSTSVLAHEDTKSSCTANDIEVLGGQIINEPCNCTPGGTFEAIAEFTVINQNNATRKCITLHLGGGGTFGGKDFLLVTGKDGKSGTSNISGLGTTQTMYAFLGTVSCNFGKECYTNSVIAFQTAQNQSDTACAGPLQKYPGGQCRRQEICITGFKASLACTANCSPDCGGTATLRAGVETAPTAPGDTPFTYVLTATTATGTSETSYGPTADTSHDFSVKVSVDTNYTLKVYDSRLGANCFRSAGPVAISANPITVTAASGTPPACAGGNSTLTASATASGSVKYEFFEGTESLGSVETSTGTGSISVLLGPGLHTIKVVASNGNCSDDETFSVTVPTPVKADLGAFKQTDCSGAGSVTATASGGTAPYTYIFTVNTVEVQRGASNVLNLAAQLDGNCRTIKVSALDKNECPSTPSAPGKETVGISQCVTTTACSA